MTTIHSPGLSFAEVRGLFPGAHREVYLDTASRSLISSDAVALVSDHLNERAQGRIDKGHYFELVETARRRYAAFIGAAAEEVSICKNVSEGLNAALQSIDWRDGDYVAVCSDIEHPNNLFACRHLERKGVSVLDLESVNHGFPVEHALRLLNSDRPPRAISVSATSFKPGFRTELGVLGAACRKVGALLIVDGAQSVGITVTDVAASAIDILVTSTQKGLCGLYGMGFLYIRKSLAERLTPVYLARFSVDMGERHEADYDTGHIRLREGALRFDLGNYNFVAAAVVGESLAMLNACGSQRIDEYVSRLAARLAAGLAAMNAPILSPPDAGSIANIICLSFTGRPAKAVQLQEWLARAGVRVAVRGDTLRYSLHIYNNEQDIVFALDTTRSWIERHQQC